MGSHPYWFQNSNVSCSCKRFHRPDVHNIYMLGFGILNFKYCAKADHIDIRNLKVPVLGLLWNAGIKCTIILNHMNLDRAEEKYRNLN